MKKDCCWTESVKPGREASSLEASAVSAARTTSEAPITWMLLQSDDAEVATPDSAQWVYSVTWLEPVCNRDFLIDSGAATSVCQQSSADSLGGKSRGLGIERRSATGHQFTTTGNTTMCLHTRDGINVSGAFQIAPKNSGLQRSIPSVGQVCDRGIIITFRSTDGMIFNEISGNRIEFERVNGAYRLLADTSAKLKPRSNGIKMLMGFEHDSEGADEAQPVKPGMLPNEPNEAEVEQHALTHLPFRSWCRHCVRAKSKESPHPESGRGGVSKFATDHMFMGEDGTPITILAGYDGLTKTFFANVVPCKGTSHGYAERALAHNVMSTGHQKEILQSDRQPSIIDVKHKAGTHIPTEIVYEKGPVGDSNANGCIERAIQTIQGQIRAIKDFTERQMGAMMSLDTSVLKWLLRRAAWTLTTFHVGSDGMIAHQRIRGKVFNQQIAAFGEQIPSKPHKTAGSLQKLAVNWLDGCWFGFNTRTWELIVSNTTEVVACQGIRRRYQEERWNRDLLLGGAREPVESARRRCGSWSPSWSTKRIHSDAEPWSCGWIDCGDEKRRARQTHLHPEEDGVWVRSKVRLQRFVC